MLRDFLSGNSQSTRRSWLARPGPNDPEMIAQLITQLQSALQNSKDGINWDLALQQANVVRGPLQPVHHACRARHPRAGDRRRSALAQRGHRDLRTDGVAATVQPLRMGRHHHADLDATGRPVATSISNSLATVLQEQAPEEMSQ